MRHLAEITPYELVADLGTRVPKFEKFRFILTLPIISILDIQNSFAETNVLVKLQESCNNNIAPSCTGLGYMYKNGDGVAQDLFKAASLYQKGCDLDDRLSCIALGRMYQDGNGVAQDLWDCIDRYHDRDRTLL